jgi:DNA-binding NarL/FixJ family response regulator
MLKAIIVIDNAITRDLLRQVLNQGGHHIVGDCSTGTQAIALINKQQPHFVCVDRELCEDGSNLLPKLRETLPKGLVFMVCSQLNAATVQTYMAQGVHGFIIQPFKTEAVLSTVKNAILALIKRQQAGKAD